MFYKKISILCKRRLGWFAIIPFLQEHIFGTIDTELIIFMIMMEGLNIKLRQRNPQVRLSYWFIFYSYNFH